ncbi:esterase-like activity of phytase family protein [Sandaracinobacteroides hominis]|uniref:esterase-like activity of phytase family protein n=1 Tax=Sandaracinobacteroides hominis TaxID=2780086 RepID=UPI0018F3F7BB|nr:esterase-like activity of phytase family protein [Sandaracinobacteroides hominis]
MPMWKWIARGLGLPAFAAGALAAAYAAGPPLGSGGVAPLDIRAVTVPLNRSDPSADRVGRLRYLGGIDLSSSDIRFGGLSGMLWEPACNRLLVVSDTGIWVALETLEEGDLLRGIRSAWIAPLLDDKGNARTSKVDADAESLARTADGATWVFFEQRHRGERYPGLTACTPETLATAPDLEFVPDVAKDWPRNGGMEAVATNGDRIVAISEEAPGKTGGRMGFSSERGQSILTFDWQNPDGHSPSAMDQLDGDTMLVLHRRVGLLTGFTVVLSEGRPGVPGDVPRELARLAAPYTVDNMEALAVRKEGERRFVYMLSDNNFIPLQRTILLKFELLPEK